MIPAVMAAPPPESEENTGPWSTFLVLKTLSVHILIFHFVTLLFLNRLYTVNYLLL